MDELRDEPFEEPVDDAVDDAVDEGADEVADELFGEASDEPADEPSQEPTSTPRPGFEATGNPEVDDVLESVSQVADLPTSEHVEIYEDAHRRLHETLVTAVDEQERPHGG